MTNVLFCQPCFQNCASSFARQFSKFSNFWSYLLRPLAVCNFCQKLSRLPRLLWQTTFHFLFCHSFVSLLKKYWQSTMVSAVAAGAFLLFDEIFFELHAGWILGLLSIKVQPSNFTQVNFSWTLLRPQFLLVLFSQV